MQAGGSDMGGYLPPPQNPYTFSRWDRTFVSNATAAPVEFSDFDGMSFCLFRALANTVRGTTPRTVGQGDYYFEIWANRDSATPSECLIGLVNASQQGSDAYPGVNANGWGYYSNTGQKATGGVFSAYGVGYGSGTTVKMGVRLDPSGGVHFYDPSGVDQGAAFTIAVGTVLYPAVGSASGAGTRAFGLNTGQKPFFVIPTLAAIGAPSICTPWG